MGNSTSTTSNTHKSDSSWAYTASDMLLGQMEKQAGADQAAGSLTWLQIASRYCAIVLSTIAALLMGTLSGALDQPKKTPVLVDAACQTEDEAFTELVVSRDWQPRHLDNKGEADDDSCSCTTETTELFTDAESDDFNSDDSDWENGESAADALLYAISDAYESASCDCETQAEQLLRLTAIVCAERDHSYPVCLDDYLCMCGECPQYKLITDDVAAAAKTPPCSDQYTQSITRLLQAFSTYNEMLGYRADMIPTARECLKTWCGDEDKAFNSFVTLYDEAPRLCDPASCD
ncbi:hypothetical protein KRP22_009300 [Phytophthora ramorum]|nr:hypothetical protein KRP22_8131 [Phytophthora ramorum]